MTGYLQLLRSNPDFARLWLAQVISLLGDWFNTIVLSALVAEYSDGSGLAVSAFLLARLLPPLVVGPFAGVLVDRFNRKRLLILSDILRALVVLLLLLASDPSRLWLIYVLTVIQFLLSAVFEPGRSAIMPSLLPQKDLVVANTLSSVTWSVMLAVGAIVGGVIATAFGTAFALIVDALSFVLSAFFISQINLLHAEDLSTHPQQKPLSERTFMDGLRYIARHPETGMTLLVKLGQSLGNVDALLIIYATEIFVVGRDGTGSLSMMFAAFGIGAVIGPLVLNRFNDGSVLVMRRLIAVGFAWIVVAWVVFSSASTLPIVLLALVMRAMGGSANWTYSSVIIQKSTPDEYLGRMFSLDMAGFQLASVISIIVTGALVESMGTENVRQIVLLLGVVAMVPLLLWTVGIIWLEKRAAIAMSIGD